MENGWITKHIEIEKTMDYCEIKSRINLDRNLIQSGNLTFPFYADSIMSVTQHWETNTALGMFVNKFKYNKKECLLNILNINLELMDESSSYLEIIYFNQQLMRDKKIEEILK